MTTKVTITAEIHQSDRRVKVTQLYTDSGSEGHPAYITKTGELVDLYVHQGNGIKVVEEQQDASGEWVAG